MGNPYRLDATAAQIAETLGADPNGDVWEGGAIKPGQYAPVVIGGSDRVRRLVPRQWGVPPPPKGEFPVTTVRNLNSPFWIGTLRHTQFRCLVPMTRFQETGGSTGARKARWHAVPSSPIFACAGIWRDSDVASYALLTTEANAVVAAGHGRTMPVILHREDYATWLTAPWKDAQHLVAPFPSQLMVAVPVSGGPGNRN